MIYLLLLFLLCVVVGLLGLLLVVVGVACVSVRSARSAVVEDRRRTALIERRKTEATAQTAEAKVLYDSEPDKPLVFTWQTTSAMRDKAHLN